MKTADQFRAYVHEMLTALATELARYEQTAHGVLPFRGINLQDVLEQVRETWLRPDAYTLSELAQKLDTYLKKSR